MLTVNAYGQCFVGQLPGTIEEFSAMIHQDFPVFVPSLAENAKICPDKYPQCL
jgi:hypothetical protein